MTINADELELKVELAEQAKSFLTSSLGQHIAARALSEKEELRDKLESFETPLDQVHQLRQEIFARTAALNWFFQTMQEGIIAQQNIDQPEE
jgi:hypothetical protein